MPLPRPVLAPARPRPTAHSAVAGLLALATAAACGDASDPVRPRAAVAPAAAARAAAEPPGPPPLLAAGFARPDSAGAVEPASTYNAAGLRVDNEAIAPGHHRLTFVGLGGVLRGAPHTQVTPVRQYSREPGTDVCIVSEALTAGGADVVVRPYCERSTRMVPVGAAAQVFDRNAPAAYATVDAAGAAENARFLARSERIGEGRYRVYFRRDPLFAAGAKPIAFVTPRSRGVTSGRVHSIACELASVGSRFERAGELGVEVDCFGSPGRRADGAFNVVALAQLPRTAYALVGDGRRLFEANSHNPGGVIGVGRAGPGTYQVYFAGLGALWSDGGTVLVTAHGANGGTCAADGWHRQDGDGQVRVDVQCRSALGDPADARFAVLATTRHDREPR